jgi:hypothetical protein
MRASKCNFLLHCHAGIMLVYCAMLVVYYGVVMLLFLVFCMICFHDTIHSILSAECLFLGSVMHSFLVIVTVLIMVYILRYSYKPMESLSIPNITDPVETRENVLINHSVILLEKVSHCIHVDSE